MRSTAIVTGIISLLLCSLIQGTEVLPLDAPAQGDDNPVVLTDRDGTMFAPPIDYGGVGSPTWIKTVDIDNDGDNDLASLSGYYLQFLKNNNGDFGTVIRYPADDYLSALCSGDFDGDGFVDFVTTSYYGSDVLIFRNGGDGTFDSVAIFSTGSTDSLAAVVVAADFDNDGDDDLAVANTESQNVRILINTGNMTFSSLQSYTVGYDPCGMTAADFNGDGYIDIAVGRNNSSWLVRILFNRGGADAGTFTLSSQVVTWVNPLGSICASDLDGDGDIDMAIPYWPSNIKVFYNDGTGNFGPPDLYTVGGRSWTICADDLDGDGDNDLVACNVDMDNFKVLLNNGDSTFSEEGGYTVGQSPYYMCIGDFDGDYDIDLAMANYWSHNVSVFMNQSGPYTRACCLPEGDCEPLTIENCLALGGTPMEAGTECSPVEACYMPDQNCEMLSPECCLNLGGEPQGAGSACQIFDLPLYSYWVGDGPNSICDADFNGDGDIDLAVANAYSNTVTVLRNYGEKTFETIGELTVGPLPVSVAAADFDQDGDVDLAVANNSSWDVSILINTGEDSFDAAVAYPVGDDPQSVVAADLNGDGYPDLAVGGNNNSWCIFILLNNGASDPGTFTPVGEIVYNLNPFQIVADDFDGDGFTDLATGLWNASEIDSMIVIFNDGSGGFDTRSSYAVGEGPNGFAAGDFDNDGDVDLAVGNRDSEDVYIFSNDGSGVFSHEETHYAGIMCDDLSAADYNNDGFLDVAAVGYDSSFVAVLINKGDGTFHEFDKYRTASNPLSISSADFDGDGFVDIATANIFADRIFVLYHWKNVGARCKVVPTHIDFPELEIGHADTALMVIYNTGTIPLSGIVSISGEDSESFTLLDNGIPSDSVEYTLAPEENVYIEIVFTASTAGLKTCVIETGLDACSNIPCNGPGPVADFAIGGLQVYANESVSTGETGVYRLSGNVNIGGLLYFPDSTIINTNDGSLSSNGEINIKTNVSWFEWVTIYNDAFTLYASDEALGFADLVNPVEFQLAGLDVAVETLVFTDGGIVVKGGLKMPEELPFSADPEDTETCYGGGIRIDSLEITRDNIVFNGLIEIPDFEAGAVSFSDGYIQLYTDSCGGIFGEDEYGDPICGSLYGGGISVEIKDKFGVGGWVQFVDGHLNKIQIDATWDPPVWIDATGLGINGASGNIEHFAPADTYPLTIDLRTRIVGGPKIGDDYLVVFDSTGLLFKYPPFSLEASCNISILGKVDMGWSSILYENSSLSLAGARNLFEMYDMSYSAHISTSDFSGNLNGSLQTPGNLPWWLDFAENKRIGNFAADLNTSYIRGKASIYLFKYPVCSWSGCRWKKVYGNLAAKIAFKSNYPFFDFYLGTNYSNFIEVIKRRDGDKLKYTFVFDSITASTSEALFYVRQPTQPLPEFYLINPLGDTLGQEELPYLDMASSGDSIYFAMYYVENPMVGQWTAVADGAGEDCEVVLKSPNSLPSIHLIEPSEPGDAPTISWTAQDFDDNAEITFYFDDDNDGFDGLPINTVPVKENTRSGSFTWDTDSISPGEYYIYGIIDDTVNAPVRLYAPGTIIVEPPVQIPAPTGLQGAVIDDAVQLTWSPVPDQAQYAAFYRNVGRLDSKPVIGSVTDSTECSIEGLVGGRTYEFMVAAVSDTGLVGEMSEPVVLTYVSPYYNSPTISCDDPASRAYVGSAYQHCFTVEDLDGDVFDLTFYRSPDGMLVSGSCINWTPAPGQDGVAFVGLRAIDRDGNADTLAFAIEVMDTTVTEPTVHFNSNSYQGEDDEGFITLAHFDAAQSDTTTDTVVVTLTSTSDQAGIEVACIETSPSSNEFTAVFAFSTEVSQKTPPQILVASGDRIMVEVPQATEDDEAIFDNAVWYELTRGCGGFDMTIEPAIWSLEWLKAGQDERVIVPTIKVILTARDTSLSVGRIKIDNLRLNGMIAPLRGSRSIIDSTMSNQSLSIEFDAILAMYSMGSVNVGSDCPVSLSGLFVDNIPFCAEGTVAVQRLVNSESTDTDKSMPETYSLSQNKPNPFNMNTVISFAIPSAGHVEVVIYNILGERVKTLTSRHYEPGTYTVEWDGSDINGHDVASGVYFYQLRADTYTETKKMVLLK